MTCPRNALFFPDARQRGRASCRVALLGEVGGLLRERSGLDLVATYVVPLKDVGVGVAAYRHGDDLRDARGHQVRDGAVTRIVEDDALAASVGDSEERARPLQLGQHRAERLPVDVKEVLTAGQPVRRGALDDGERLV